MNEFSTRLIALLPPILVTATIVAVVLAIAVRRNHLMVASLTIIGLIAALVSMVGTIQVTPLQVTPLYTIDNYALFYMGICLLVALACTVLAYGYLKTLDDRRAEYYILLLCSTLGAMTLVASRHMASLFIGLELLSVPLYGMIAYAYRDRVSLESGLKYMVLSGVASSFLLFGMALLYAASGTLQFADLGQAAANGGAFHSWLLLGIGMMVVALAFKLSLAPFHLWTPDVYQGAPGASTTFLSTVSKVAVFAVLLRLFTLAPPAQSDWLHELITAIAFISMLGGNLLALRQHNLKRMLGYSTVAHLGYLLTTIAAGGAFAIEAAGVYLAVYVATTVGAFGVVSLISTPDQGNRAGDLADYRGLFTRQPALAVVLAVMMLSLAGIPLTAGFIGKFYALAVAVKSNLWWLAGAIVAGSGIGLYYYLRVMVLVFLAPKDGQPGRTSLPARRCSRAMLVLIAVAVIFFGIYPQPVISLVEATAMGGG